MWGGGGGTLCASALQTSNRTAARGSEPAFPRPLQVPTTDHLHTRTHTKQHAAPASAVHDVRPGTASRPCESTLQASKAGPDRPDQTRPDQTRLYQAGPARPDQPGRTALRHPRVLVAPPVAHAQQAGPHVRRQRAVHRRLVLHACAAEQSRARGAGQRRDAQSQAAQEAGRQQGAKTGPAERRAASDSRRGTPPRPWLRVMPCPAPAQRSTPLHKGPQHSLSQGSSFAASTPPMHKLDHATTAPTCTRPPPPPPSSRHSLSQGSTASALRHGSGTSCSSHSHTEQSRREHMPSSGHSGHSQYRSTWGRSVQGGGGGDVVRGTCVRGGGDLQIVSTVGNSARARGARAPDDKVHTEHELMLESQKKGCTQHGLKHCGVLRRRRVVDEER